MASGSDDRLEERLWGAERDGSGGGVSGKGGGQMAAARANSCCKMQHPGPSLAPRDFIVCARCGYRCGYRLRRSYAAFYITTPPCTITLWLVTTHLVLGTDEGDERGRWLGVRNV
jgi:hypothetical protein